MSRIRGVRSTVVENVDDAGADVAERLGTEVAEVVEEWIPDLPTLGSEYPAHQEPAIVGQGGFRRATPARGRAARDEALVLEGREAWLTRLCEKRRVSARLFKPRV